MTTTSSTSGEQHTRPAPRALPQPRRPAPGRRRHVDRPARRAGAPTSPRPAAVLIVSAHWEVAPLAVVGDHGDVPLLYDFWGFPQHYYEVTYDAPGAAEPRPVGGPADG